VCSTCVKGKTSKQQVTIDVDNDDGDVVCLGSTSAQTPAPPPPPTSTSLRLVQLRNPWGKKEWSGEFGTNSEVWTKKLRKLLKYDTYKDAKGEFWIPYDEFVRKFSSVDVCKVHDGWILESYDNGLFGGEKYYSPHSASSNPYKPQPSSLSSFTPSSTSYLIPPQNSGVWCYAMSVQRKRRNTTSVSQKYVDVNFLLLRQSPGGELEVVDVVISGETRLNTLEFILESGSSHVLVPFTTSPPSPNGVPFRLERTKSEAKSEGWSEATVKAIRRLPT